MRASVFIWDKVSRDKIILELDRIMEKIEARKELLRYEYLNEREYFRFIYPLEYIVLKDKYINDCYSSALHLTAQIAKRERPEYIPRPVDGPLICSQ